MRRLFSGTTSARGRRCARSLNFPLFTGRPSTDLRRRVLTAASRSPALSRRHGARRHWHRSRDAGPLTIAHYRSPLSAPDSRKALTLCGHVRNDESHLGKSVYAIDPRPAPRQALVFKMQTLPLDAVDVARVNSIISSWSPVASRFRSKIESAPCQSPRACRSRKSEVCSGAAK